MVLDRFKVPTNHELTVLKNPDLEPMPPHRRIWGFLSFFGYWGIPNLTIWTWSTGSALVSLGLSIGHIMGALTLGNLLICIYTCLNSNPGLKYHVGYTMCQRMIFGIYGSGLGILVRIILSIIFYGAQAWLGGLCVVVTLSSLSESFLNLTHKLHGVQMALRDFIGFLIFQIIQMGFFFFKPERLNNANNIACLITSIAFIVILIICLVKNDGPGPLYDLPNKTDNVGWMWLYAITIWYGALSPDITNQCDYSRFASGERSTYLGIITAIMITGTFVPLASLLVVSTTVEMYQEAFWLPTDLCLSWLRESYSPGIRAGNFFLGLCFMSSQLTFNVLANGFTGGMDLAGILPQYINIRRGATITALLSWCVQPWNFYNTSSTFMSVMSSFGVVITPIIAITVCDFYLIRNATLPISELYSTSPTGSFYFQSGINFRALIVWIISIFPGIPGLINSVKANPKIPIGFDNFFYGSALFLFILPFGLYYLVCYVFPPRLNNVNDTYDYFNAFTIKECQKLNMEPYNDIQTIEDEIVQISDSSSNKATNDLNEFI